MKIKSTIVVLLALVAAACSAQAGQILIINNSLNTSEPGTTSAVTNNLTTLENAVGNTVTVMSGIPVSLAGFSQVWDVSFNDNAALTAAGQSQYLSYLQGGGGLFLMGENSGFLLRDNSIIALIAAAGGGTVGFDSCSDGLETVQPPFTGPNSVTKINFATSGCFLGKGTGSWISTSDNTPNAGAGIAFGTGTLLNANKGALTAILDVNFMMNSFDLPNSQNLTKNLINFVDVQVPGNAVPEPATLGLMAIAMLSICAARRRRIRE